MNKHKRLKQYRVITIAGSISADINRIKIWDDLIYKVIFRSPWGFIVESTKEKIKSTIIDLDLSLKQNREQLGLEVLEYINHYGITFYDFVEVKKTKSYILEKAKFINSNDNKKGNAFYLGLDKCDRQLIGIQTGRQFISSSFAED